MVWALDETGTVDASLLCKNYEHNKRLALIEQKEMSGNWTRHSGGGTPSPRGGRTEQLRKLGNFLDYYLDKFNQKDATSNEIQSSVAVGTAERGLSPSRMLYPWELFSPYEMALSICI